MKRQAIVEALRDAIAEEMERDETVFCIGEDIAVPGGWGGAFTVTLGLEKRFPDRMINTPIAELGFFGIAVGAAMMGMRPIADVQYGDFLFLASDQIINCVMAAGEFPDDERRCTAHNRRDDCRQPTPVRELCVQEWVVLVELLTQLISNNFEAGL